MTNTTTMSHDVRLDTDHETAIARVTEALAAEGFGVLSRIDIHCNPGLAHLALGARPEVGLLLPCNVVVERRGDEELVRIIDAIQMMDMGGFGDDPKVKPIALEAAARLGRVVEALR
jgi:uncharacterized protein (DUF302 family)